MLSQVIFKFICVQQYSASRLIEEGMISKHFWGNQRQLKLPDTGVLSPCDVAEMEIYLQLYHNH